MPSMLAFQWGALNGFNACMLLAASELVGVTLFKFDHVTNYNTRRYLLTSCFPRQRIKELGLGTTVPVRKRLSLHAGVLLPCLRFDCLPLCTHFKDTAWFLCGGWTNQL